MTNGEKESATLLEYKLIIALRCLLIRLVPLGWNSVGEGQNEKKIAIPRCKGGNVFYASSNIASCDTLQDKECVY